MRSFYLNSTLLILFFTAATIQANAQYDEKILQSANAWAEAERNDDFESKADYTSPRLLAVHGGREKWIKTHKKMLEKLPAIRDSIRTASFAAARAEGKIVITSKSSNESTKRNLTFSKPGKIHTAGDEIYCLVPFYNTIPVRSKLIHSYGSLLAVSNDQGGSWTFAEVTYSKDDFFARFFPTFDKKAIKHKPKESKVEDNPNPQTSQPPAPPMLKIALAKWNAEAMSDSRLLPKYGGKPKPKEQIKADNALIDQYLSQFVSRRRASDTLVSLGFKHLYSKDLKTAMYRFNQAWLLDSTNSNAYWGFGAVYVNLNDTSTGLKQYDDGLLLEPNNSKILTDKGTLYLMQFEKNSQKDSLNKAIDFFQASYALDPKYPANLFKLSVAYFFLDDCANAIKYHDECKAVKPQMITQTFSVALHKRCQ